MTIGGNWEAYGDRIPALWLNGGSNPYLTAASAINGNSNYHINHEVTTNTWIKVKMHQKK